MNQEKLQTVAETTIFAKRAEAILSPEEKDELIYTLADDPLAGVEIPDTGGVRKLRWAARGKGSKGGVRVIYFFHNEHSPLYALYIFGKGEKEDLTPEEKRAMKQLAAKLKTAAKEKSRRAGR